MLIIVVMRSSRRRITHLPRYIYIIHQIVIYIRMPCILIFWISASHFVGYVEDFESPEMIMKKFERLDALQEEIRAAKVCDIDVFNVYSYVY